MASRCQICHGKGVIGFLKCPACQGEGIVGMSKTEAREGRKQELEEFEVYHEQRKNIQQDIGQERKGNPEARTPRDERERGRRET